MVIVGVSGRWVMVGMAEVVVAMGELVVGESLSGESLEGRQTQRYL